MRNSKSESKQSALECSLLICELCVDVHAEIFGFLEANDQAKLRRTSTYFCTVFDHAFQRGYVAAAICEYCVATLDILHEDDDDGHPLLRVAPVDPTALFWQHKRAIRRAEEDSEATLFVNVRLVLGSQETVLSRNFLFNAPFKAVHFFATETLTDIADNCLREARELQTFTMTTPAPLLLEAGDSWLCACSSLQHFDLSGCDALETVGDHWLFGCAEVASASFKGLGNLQHVGEEWMRECRKLVKVDFSELSALEEVGGYWLFGCESLRAANFSPCGALRAVGNCWMSECTSLATIDLRGCLALEDVGWRFAAPRYNPMVWPVPPPPVSTVQEIFVSEEHCCLPSNITKEFMDKVVVFGEQ